jgi:aerobic carbon-monoxide dehydrogenase small subunit
LVRPGFLILNKFKEQRSSGDFFLEANMVEEIETANWYETRSINLTVNGKAFLLEVGKNPHQISPSHTLIHTLRETLGLTGAKKGCDQGACGGCTVIMDGKAVLSCMILTVECDAKHVTTIEGLQDSDTGRLDPLQEAFADTTAFQCGFCTPGMIMTSRALLNRNPNPTTEEIKEALSGNFCRCISHYHVIDAVSIAAGKGGSDD